MMEFQLRTVLFFLILFSFISYSQTKEEQNLENEMQNYQQSINQMMEQLPESVKYDVEAIKGEEGDRPRPELSEKEIEQMKNDLNSFMGEISNKDGTMKKNMALSIYESEYLEKVVKANQKVMATMSDKQLEDMIYEKVGETKIGKFFDKYPKTLIYIVKVLKDEHALINMVKIVKDKERLKIYGISALSIGITGFFIRRRKPKGLNFFDRIIRQIVLAFFFAGLIFSTFIFIFRQELAPFYNIAKDTFL